MDTRISDGMIETMHKEASFRSQKIHIMKKICKDLNVFRTLSFNSISVNFLKCICICAHLCGWMCICVVVLVNTV